MSLSPPALELLVAQWEALSPLQIAKIAIAVVSGLLVLKGLFHAAETCLGAVVRWLDNRFGIVFKLVGIYMAVDVLAAVVGSVVPLFSWHALAAAAVEWVGLGEADAAGTDAGAAPGWTAWVPDGVRWAPSGPGGL